MLGQIMSWRDIIPVNLDDMRPIKLGSKGANCRHGMMYRYISHCTRLNKPN